MERCLIIVSRDRPDLWQELTQNYAHADGVEIILDRRQAERWTPARESADRRSSADPGTRMQDQGFVVIPRR